MSAIYGDILPITPSDGATPGDSVNHLPYAPSIQGGLICGVSGNIKVLTPGGGTTPQTIPIVASNVPLALQITKLFQTGTTATSIFMVPRPSTL